jgi:hypothetical protein
MDKDLMDAPLFWFWLELPHLARDIFECFEEKVKAFAVEFKFFSALLLIHFSSSF